MTTTKTGLALKTLFTKLALAHYNEGRTEPVEADDPYFQSYLIMLMWSSIDDKELAHWVDYFQRKSAKK
jgi:hypothetical protein